MVKPEDFLSHAADLVRDGTEIDARRAVSAAYYGVFHSLASAVMVDWSHQAATEAGRTFLLKLLLGPRLGRRG